MARNRSAGVRPLTWEQRAALGSGLGILLVDADDETASETLTRLFGSLEAAEAGWSDNRVMLLARDPMAGRRPPGWWVCQQHREPPLVEEQAAILAELGELSESEVKQLAAEAAMRKHPEAPVDLGVDHVATITIEPPIITIAPTPEEPHDDEPTPQADTGPGAHEAPGESGGAQRADAPAPEPAGDGEAPDAAADPPERSIIRLRSRDVTNTPWPRLDGTGRPPDDGWETHDVR